MSAFKRPVLKLPLSPRESALEVVSVGGLAFLLYTFLIGWVELPDVIPTHFGATGEADSWGPKSTLLVLPILTVVLYALLIVLSRFPHIYNYPVAITEENAERLYRLGREAMYWLKAQLVWMMGYLQWSMIQVSLGRAEKLNATVMWLFVAALFVTAGWLAVKSYREK